MNTKTQFNQIRDFLIPYQGIWENEILHQYPTPFQYYNQEWIDYLINLPEEKLFCLEKKDFKNIEMPKDLYELFTKSYELTQLPQAKKIEANPYDHYAFLKIKPKKIHEIKTIAPYVAKIYQEEGLLNVIDIGGGIGYMAQTLSNYFNLTVSSIDMDPVLQNTGKLRNQKNAKDPSNKVNYINSQIDLKNLELKEIFTGKSLSLGLHTCGDLANSQIELTAQGKQKGLLNFGCCYYRLAKNNVVNISLEAKKNPISLNLFALTLATRAHKKLDHWDFEFKSKVKFYRYALHFYLYDVLGVKEFVSVGNSTEKLYNQDFATYTKEQLKRLNLSTTDQDDTLNAYFEKKEIQKLIYQMIYSGIIRGIFGRPLELYVLLDRCLYLEEHGYNVSLEEFFNEEVSPRNIGITAILKN